MGSKKIYAYIYDTYKENSLIEYSEIIVEECEKIYKIIKKDPCFTCIGEVISKADICCVLADTFFKRVVLLYEKDEKKAAELLLNDLNEHYKRKRDELAKLCSQIEILKKYAR